MKVHIVVLNIHITISYSPPTFKFCHYQFTGLERSVKYFENAMTSDQSHHSSRVESVIHTGGTFLFVSARLILL